MSGERDAPCMPYGIDVFTACCRIKFMRILFCTHDIDSGGSARSLLILIKQLIKQHEIRILSLIKPNPDKQNIRIYHELGIPVFIFPWGWIPISYINCQVSAEEQQKKCEQLRKFIPEIRNIAQNVDIICFNGYPSTSLSRFFPISIPKFLIAREVLMESDHNFERIGKFLHGQMQRAVAIGPVESAQLARFGIPHSIIFNSAPHHPKILPLPIVPPLRFGVFTQFSPGKGLDVLALAVEKAAQNLRRYGAKIHVYGGSVGKIVNYTQKTICDFIIQKGLNDILRLEGWTNDVESSMQNMHCIVRPDSTGSPWGRDVLEAMSLGRPVLGTGAADIFVKEGVTGWLVPPRDPSALARALVGLTRTPSLVRRLGENAHAFAKEHFDPEINSRRIEEEMLSIL